MSYFANRNHNKLRTLLSSYIDGEVNEQEKHRVETHLAGCAECREELESLRSTVGLLGLMPALELPRSFVLSEAPRPARQPSSFIWGARLATSVAAVLLVALVMSDAVGVLGPRGFDEGLFMSGEPAYAPSSAPAAAPAPQSAMVMESSGTEPPSMEGAAPEMQAFSAESATAPSAAAPAPEGTQEPMVAMQAQPVAPAPAAPSAPSAPAPAAPSGNSGEPGAADVSATPAPQEAVSAQMASEEAPNAARLQTPPSEPVEGQTTAVPSDMLMQDIGPTEEVTAGPEVGVAAMPAESEIAKDFAEVGEDADVATTAREFGGDGQGGLRLWQVEAAVAGVAALLAALTLWLSYRTRRWPFS
jgi:hypothetical protein